MRKRVRNRPTRRRDRPGRKSGPAGSPDSQPPEARLSEVEAVLRRTVATVEEVFGPGHPHMATALENLAGALRRMGRREEATEADVRALEIRNAALVASAR